ncbi:ubiquitin-like modifier-activating enzyme ATG7 isoform X2 [Hydractinia symbiolongicarpus]|uniref:ubiquitin-like modifier-activating enzyme ATG7 isoform X2 n=1 Tax=Hydractinia symbiolongicarpus TaxID=13093 RepID=UPI00254D1E19|nr:ubiquitin-like modifier-activating enzyme ATG7 isoform X2 [Hydractinia symbiolongicarpus]
MAAKDAKLLQYLPFASAVDIGFWHKLTKNKLEHYKLDDSAQKITGSFVNNDPNGLPCRINVDFTAFDVEKVSHVPRSFKCPGSIFIKNTTEEFKNCDKKLLVKDAANKIVSDIKSGAVEKNPELLNRFLVLTFADLKKYHFYYWFAFPAVSLKENFVVASQKTITEACNKEELASLQTCYDSLNQILGHDPSVFLLKKSSNAFLSAQLHEWDSFYQNDSEVTIGFSDPSTLSEHPGWPLRNLLTYVAYKRGKNIKKLTVICYRDRIRDGRREIEHSLVIEFNEIPQIDLNEDETVAIGWEKNQRDKMGPRMVNLSSTMDPVKLAESAVDLNLKLMRWRLVPDLNLEKISATKCLLLGSGTLGCNVARSLLGWGVRTITFVDNSKVSYSNPVRQTLFAFEDCLNGGKPKAQAAADSLKRIFPGVNSSAYELSIPMPGHSVVEKDEERIKRDVELLEKLIEEHDAIFLLMDTRESRWLPTVIANSKEKILINAALGFDTFMIMRHGFRTKTKPTESSNETLSSKSVRMCGSQLGCYFCNDVVAPGNSMLDRTLDQQCTVSRPGVSMMASALAVELLVSILQHPLGPLAPAETSANENHLTAEFETPLGIIPHQLRCFLSRYHTVLPATLAFDKCTGCSPLVIEAYEREGFKFLKQAFNIPKYIEDMTGLTELHNSIVDADIWELSDMDDDDDDRE